MNSRSERMRKRDATGVHADERQRRQTVIALDYLVREPADGAADVIGREDNAAGEGNGSGQRKTPTLKREGEFSHAMCLSPRADAGTSSVLGCLTRPRSRLTHAVQP